MSLPARRRGWTLPALAALCGLSAALAGTPASAWSAPALGSATYVILDPRIEGHPDVLSAEQRGIILGTMRRDSGNAIKRRYPGATLVTDAATPGAVRVTPVLVTPGALVPWAKLGARLDFDLPGGERVTLGDSFGLLTVWQRQAEAANYVFGELVKRLP